MTVPFRPTVDVEPNDFLSTLTRTFRETSNLVEEDRRRKRAAERFSTEQELGALRVEELSKRISLRDRAQAEREARDPSIQPAAPTGGREGGEFDEIARAIDPLTPAAQLFPEDIAPPAAAPGTRPIAGTGQVIVPGARGRQEQRLQGQQRTQAGGDARRIIGRLADTIEASDPDQATALRDRLDTIVARIEAGTPPNQAVDDALREIKEGQQSGARVAFLKTQVGEENLPDGLDTLTIDQQEAELERIRNQEARREPRPTGQLTESAIANGVRRILEDQGILPDEATPDQMVEARETFMSLVESERETPEARETRQTPLVRTQASRILKRIENLAASLDIQDQDEFQRQLTAMRRRIADGDLEALRSVVQELNDTESQLGERRDQ